MVLSAGTGLVIRDWSRAEISIVVGADVKLAFEFRFCVLKSSNQAWDIIRTPSEQSPESTGI